MTLFRFALRQAEMERVGARHHVRAMTQAMVTRKTGQSGEPKSLSCSLSRSLLRKLNSESEIARCNLFRVSLSLFRSLSRSAFRNECHCFRDVINLESARKRVTRE